MEQLLTISIPTFNRPEQIQTQVRLLLPQLDERICLVVYDNCSQVLVKKLFTENELTQFTIIRNRMNVGGDANIARCFEYCLTPWLWTLSDDDFVKSDAVDIVLKEIMNNSESVFINFYSERYFITVGFEELAFEFRSEKVFGNSFAMASCVYNMSKLQDSLQDYYNNLSSNLGTIILVLKYVQKHNKVICVFTDKSPIKDYNTEVGWNYGVYIRRTKQFIEAFEGGNIRQYNRTLFLGCHKVNYLLILMNRKGSKMSYCQRWRAYWQTIQNQGFINALLYSPKIMTFTFLYLILQHRWLKWILRLNRIIKNKSSG
jgi:glycosyltransferase involved in cell wall biosynthesis